MGIINLTTNLRDSSKFKPRGRIENEGLRRVEDVKRMGKWFSTTQGILFTLKQKALAFSVNSQLEDLRKFNNNLYSPSNTLLSVGTSGTGVRFTKQGIFPAKSIIKYEEVDEIKNEETNRLVKEYKERKKDPLKTTISWRNLKFVKSESNPSKLVFERERDKKLNPKLFKPESNIYNLVLERENDKPINLDSTINKNIGGRLNIDDGLKYYTSESFVKSNYNDPLYLLVKSRTDEETQTTPKPSGDFTNQWDRNSPNAFILDNYLERGLGINLHNQTQNRKNKLSKPSKKLVGDIGEVSNQIESDKSLKSKTKENNKLYYNVDEETKSKLSTYLDPINLHGIGGELDDKDLITFKISHIGRRGITSTVYFRAYLNPISDQYIADWTTERFAGRGEEFFTYAGFSRNLGLGFSILAQSRMELEKIYEKLNYLSSLMTPTYINNIMSGNIVQLTIGNYIKNLPGVITGFSYDIGEDVTWDIEKNSQLPILIRVNGFNFKPIHKFVPEFRPSEPHKYVGMEMEVE